MNKKHEEDEKTQQDARRYQALRSAVASDDHEFFDHCAQYAEAHYANQEPTNDEFDATIDYALGKKNKL